MDHELEVALPLFIEMISKLNNVYSLRTDLSIWCKIHTPNSKYYVAVVYQSPEPAYSSVELLDVLSGCCEHIVSSDPNAKIIIAGDINQLNIRYFVAQYVLDQMVKVPTRDEKTPGVFMTNCPHLCVTRPSGDQLSFCARASKPSEIF